MVVEGAMTDPKGDRAKRPAEQADPDMFVRVVDEDSRGVVIRGAKAHQTGALNSHEILVMPTTAMRADEAAYAVCCAVPADAPGVTFILGRQPSDTRKREGCPVDVGNAFYGSQEALVVFDDVFVPWERVFMNGEYDQSGKVVERFAAFHRQSYGGCKVGVGDVFDWRRPAGRALAGGGARLPRAGQAHRDGPLERDPLRLRHRLQRPG